MISLRKENEETKSCTICGVTENLLRHHISYRPEVTQVVCTPCHYRIHGSVFFGSAQTVIAARLPKGLSKIVKEYVKSSSYLNLGEFIQDAIKEKFKQDPLVRMFMKKDVNK